MRRDFAVFLLSIFAISALSAVPVDIQVSVDPNLPVALYEGPQTYRRDSRGRPFKSIIVTSSKLFGLGSSSGSNFVRDSSTTSSTTSTTTTTTTPAPPPRRPLNVSQRLKPFIVTSRPFGFANSASNLVRDSSTTTTSTTTTPSPLFDKAAPTIPFFSISCTVGSSCSQIISARQTQTAKPTFKPYTKEEINKFKGSLGSRFPPKVTPSTISSEPSEISTATTEKPTTEKPSSVWRIRTTSPPNPTTTAISSSSLSSTTTTRPIKNIPSSNWSSRWKWPTHIGSVASEDHKQDEIESSNQRVETVTSEPTTVAVKSSPQKGALNHPTYFSEFPIRSNTYSVKPYTTREKYDSNKDNSYPKQRPEGINTKPPVATGNNNWLSLLAASMSALQNQKQNLNAAQRPQTLQQTKGHPPALPLSTQFPVKTVSKPVKLRPNPTTTPPAPEQDRWNSPALTNTEEENSLSWPEKASGFTGYSISLPENDQDYHRHEVISSKGNKISLITGSSTRNKQANKPVKALQSYQNANRANLPPEVSVI